MSTRCNAAVSAGLDLYRREALRVARPRGAEQRRLLARLRSGDTQAVDQIALAYLGLVVERVDARRTPRDDPLEMLEAGNGALMDAIREYDPAYGALAAHVSACIDAALDHLNQPAA